MKHEIHRVTGFEKAAPFMLRVQFEDGTSQLIDFRPVLAGEMYGPLANPHLFDSVKLDEEAHTLLWANGTDFDPAILHDWPVRGPELVRLAQSWVAVAT